MCNLEQYHLLNEVKVVRLSIALVQYRSTRKADRLLPRSSQRVCIYVALDRLSLWIWQKKYFLFLCEMAESW